MAKMIVEIDFPEDTSEKLRGWMEEHREEMFPRDDPRMISVDETALERDPTDDSYYLFRFRGIED